MIGAATGPGIELARGVFGTIAVVSLLRIAGKAVAQLLAGVLVGLTCFAMIEQGLKVAFAELPELVLGLCRQIRAIDQLRFEVAHLPTV